MEELRVEVGRTARVCVEGDLRAAREVWFVVHGYAQRADEMLAVCEPFASRERALVAPEALSRFYRRGSSGPIGASWMTREMRESEIADYVAYLDRVAELVRDARAGAPTRFVALGFSQGAATIWRWLARGATRCDAAIGWGGGFPPDLDAEALRDRLARTALFSVRGSRDGYHTAEWLARDVELAARHGLGLRWLSFEGGHELAPAACVDLLAALAR